jgi:hypothetical protein
MMSVTVQLNRTSVRLKGVPMKIPESTRSSLTLRLSQRQRERWPDLEKLTVRFRGEFAYVDGATPDSDGQVQPLLRLRYGGSATFWGFAIYTWSGMRYEDSVLPTGAWEGTPEQALDCACGLYLRDPSAWVTN